MSRTHISRTSRLTAGCCRGYRIRQVTEAEKGNRTTQAVLQQREYEEGLVSAYRQYLETCETAIRTEGPLASVALKCLCELLKEKSYFNFAINIMEVVVKTLGRRDFDSVRSYPTYAGA